LENSAIVLSNYRGVIGQPRAQEAREARGEREERNTKETKETKEAREAREASGKKARKRCVLTSARARGSVSTVA
jgi:hypothetical protein